MTRLEDHNKTPWQKVFSKFGRSQSDFAKAINCHRSKVSRALKDDKGLINGRDQLQLIKVAQELNIDLTPDDLTPGM